MSESMTEGAPSTLLEIADLRITFDGRSEAVRGVDLRVTQGQIHALVGESGSGKSATAMSVLQLLPTTAHTQGTISFQGRDLAALTRRRMRAIRGVEIGTVFQEPMTALNPAIRIGHQIGSALRPDVKMNRREIRTRCIELLEAVHIRDPELKMKQYPHELSGGQRQRVMIAMAVANEPRLLIADEPTTALDVTVQAEILQLIRELRDRLGMGVLLITHDLGVVANVADSVSVMHAGEIVERGSLADIFEHPTHAYTRELLKNSDTGDVRVTARANVDSTRSQSRDPAPLVSFRGLTVRYPGMSTSQPAIVKGIDLDLGRHETLAIVGESGSGKSTLGRAIAGLLPPTYDEARIAGHPVQHARGLLGAVTTSFVFQDSASALNPRLTIGESILAPRRYADASAAEVSREAAAELLDHVGLDPGWVDLLPHQLSGGQRQRVGIARAIARPPELLIADEPTSALDVGVQKRILVLLARLQLELGFSCIFITHDLHLVRSFADRVVVLQDGSIQEEGRVDEVLTDPESDYTRQLLASTFDLGVTARSAAEPFPA